MLVTTRWYSPPRADRYFRGVTWADQTAKPRLIDVVFGETRWTDVELVGLNSPEILFTLPETNIAPENGWLEYYFPIGEAYFQ